MRRLGGGLFALLLHGILATGLQAQDAAFRVEPIDQLPAELPQAIRDMNPNGFRVFAEDSKPVAEFWVLKELSAKAKPAGPDGAVQFPFLNEGELLGVVRFLQEVHDHREQSILPGFYTIRFGLHPINGDHLGVSPFRDYGLLLPAEKDDKPAPPDRKALESLSAEASGTNHPAVMLLQIVKGGAKVGSLVRNEEKNFWGVVVGLNLKVAGQAEPVLYPMEVVFSGAAAK